NRCRAHVPDARAVDRGHQGAAPLEGPPREALLPAPQDRQGRAPDRDPHERGSRHDVTLAAWRRLARAEAKMIGRDATTVVAGVDEAGRAPLAGPVVAAAVILAPGVRWDGLDDSKVLDAETRAELYARVLNEAPALAWPQIGTPLTRH